MPISPIPRYMGHTPETLLYLEAPAPGPYDYLEPEAYALLAQLTSGWLGCELEGVALYGMQEPLKGASTFILAFSTRQLLGHARLPYGEHPETYASLGAVLFGTELHKCIVLEGPGDDVAPYDMVLLTAKLLY